MTTIPACFSAPMVNDTLDAQGDDTQDWEFVREDDGTDADVAIVGGYYDFTGGETSEYALRTGGSGSDNLSGGGGNDTFIAVGQGKLSGGDGDDVLKRNDAQRYDNILDGRAGNDQIYFDYDDRVIGGEGADLLVGVSDDHNFIPNVADFDPAEDRMIIWSPSINVYRRTVATHRPIPVQIIPHKLPADPQRLRCRPLHVILKTNGYV